MAASTFATVDGDFVLWSDVEPLLRPLTDEQVEELATALSRLRDAYYEVRDCYAARTEQYIADCRAALKEVGR